MYTESSFPYMAATFSLFASIYEFNLFLYIPFTFLSRISKSELWLITICTAFTAMVIVHCSLLVVF